MIRFEVIGRAVFHILDLHIGNFILIIAVIGSDFNNLTFFGIFQAIEIGVVMAGYENRFAISGNRTAIINADTISESHIAVAEKEFCVDLAVFNNQLTKLIVI